MASRGGSFTLEETTNQNITIRRSTNQGKSKMACNPNNDPDLDLIVDILSKDEAEDVMNMLRGANELQDNRDSHSFYTSTQMGGTRPSRPISPLLSPLLSRDLGRTSGPTRGNRFDILAELPDGINGLGGFSDSLLEEKLLTIDKAYLLNEREGNNWGNTGRDLNVGRALVSDRPPPIGTSPMGSDAHVWEERHEDGHDNAVLLSNKPGNDFQVGTLERDAKINNDANGMNGQDSENGSTSGDGGNGEATDVKPGCLSVDQYHDQEAVVTRLLEVDELLLGLGNRSGKLEQTVKDLVTSLEYSQSEIDKLKRENTKLRTHIESMENEDKRTQYQVKKTEVKLEKLETASKKKNLVIEGIPEVDGSVEDVEKTLGKLFDRLQIKQRVNFDACYRLGAYNNRRDRPILVCFEKMADRDLIYNRRMELRRTPELKQIWINEDIGPEAKRKQGVIRLINREAQQQGIDCRTGKYTVFLNKTKFDADNLDELPKQLRPSCLKQVMIDDQTLAYQSEHAPFSNFFHCQVLFGSLRFSCLEQAYQFLKAKTMGKPLAATKIYLSRDVIEMKRIGDALGTTPEWESKQLDIMYICLKRKFEQNSDLREMLLQTGDIQLVEATPDRFWGCGATLSSNVLRRHEWPGKNKHGEILMTVRGELRNKAKAKARNIDH